MGEGVCKWKPSSVPFQRPNPWIPKGITTPHTLHILPVGSTKGVWSLREGAVHGLDIQFPPGGQSRVDGNWGEGKSVRCDKLSLFISCMVRVMVVVHCSITAFFNYGYVGLGRCSIGSVSG